MRKTKKLETEYRLLFRGGGGGGETNSKYFELMFEIKSMIKSEASNDRHQCSQTSMLKLKVRAGVGEISYQGKQIKIQINVKMTFLEN